MGTFIHHQEHFDIQLNKFEILEFDASLLDLDVKIQSNVRGVQSFVGFITFFVPIDDQIICGSKTLIKQGNKYSYFPFRLPSSRACSSRFLESCM